MRHWGPWLVFRCVREFCERRLLLAYLPTYSVEHVVLLDKLTGLQLVKKFPKLYGTRRFITAFTIARHLSPSWASWIQSTPLHPTSWRSILILSSHLRLGLPSGLFPSGFPIKTLCAPPHSLIRPSCPAQLILLDFITLKVVREVYRSLSSSLCSFLPLRCYLIPLRPNRLNNLFSNTINPRSSLNVSDRAKDD